MSDSTNYTLVLTGADDPDYVIFKLLKDVPEARSHLDENGRSTHNGYDWRTLRADLASFSKAFPDVLFFIREKSQYEDENFEVRHYAKNGRCASIEPKITVEWPTFSEDLLE